MVALTMIFVLLSLLMMKFALPSDTWPDVPWRSSFGYIDILATAINLSLLLIDSIRVMDIPDY